MSHRGMRLTRGRAVTEPILVGIIELLQATLQSTVQHLATDMCQRPLGTHCPRLSGPREVPGFLSSGVQWPKPQLGLQQPGLSKWLLGFQRGQQLETARRYSDAGVEPVTGFWILVETVMLGSIALEVCKYLWLAGCPLCAHCRSIRCSRNEVLTRFPLSVHLSIPMKGALLRIH